MAQMMSCRASALMGIDDDYIAWCMDEAAATILAALRQGRKIRPRRTADNWALIHKLTGGEHYGD